MNEALQNSSVRTAMIHRAPWVVVDTAHEIYQDSRGVIEDGALYIEGSIIRAVGKSGEILSEHTGVPVRDHEGRILAPALINGHCHLELSYMDLADPDRRPDDYLGDPTGWIWNLLQARDAFLENPDAGGQLICRAEEVLAQMTAEGVAFIGDIGNSLTSSNICGNRRTRVHFLLELLGLTKKSEEQALRRLEKICVDETSTIACTAHAPYSTAPGLLREIKRIAGMRGNVFSIHVAESEPEREFLQTGAGPFLDFLHERGAWDNSFAVPGVGPVEYLERLGVLDERTLCVHAVHVDSEETAVLAARKAKICLCPGSNRFLGVGKAPVTEFLGHGILPALGTDSRASNPVLSIWREMRLLREDHPGVSPATVFSMATRGGAEAWGIDSVLGTAEPGKKGLVMSVTCRPEIKSRDDLLEYLTTAGETVQVEWIE